MMKKQYIPIAIALFTMSCEKEIVIDLNKSNPKFVIEAVVSTGIGETNVRIIKTLNFDDTRPFPAISNAAVTITNHNTNKIDTLTETTAGKYSKPNLVGIAGNAYTLLVKIEGKIFTATSTIPYQVSFDGLIQENLAAKKFTTEGTIIRISPKYTDPAAYENYYQFVVSKNGTLLNDIFIRDDIGFNGSAITRALRIKANKKDSIKVDMQGIDKAAYDYFFGLNENINQSSATPANPTSNISNGALGYFKAHTSHTKTIVIK